MLRVVDFVVEYNSSKLRLSLPSRREPTVGSSASTSTSTSPAKLQWPSWSNRRAFGFSTKGNNHNNRKSKKAKRSGQTEQQQQLEDYVFLEDLLRLLQAKFTLPGGHRTAQAAKQQPHSLSTTVTNYKVQIYNASGELAFEVLFRHDGRILNMLTSGQDCSSSSASTSTSTSASGAHIFSSPYGIRQCLVAHSSAFGVEVAQEVPAKAKVFSRSYLHLFKETLNLATQLTPTSALTAPSPSPSHSLPSSSSSASVVDDNNNNSSEVNEEKEEKDSSSPKVLKLTKSLDYEEDFEEYEEVKKKKKGKRRRPLPKFEHLPESRLDASFGAFSDEEKEENEEDLEKDWDKKADMGEDFDWASPLAGGSSFPPGLSSLLAATAATTSAISGAGGKRKSSQWRPVGSNAHFDDYDYDEEVEEEIVCMDLNDLEVPNYDDPELDFGELSSVEVARGEQRRRRNRARNRARNRNNNGSPQRPLPDTEGQLSDSSESSSSSSGSYGGSYGGAHHNRRSMSTIFSASGSVHSLLSSEELAEVKKVAISSSSSSKSSSSSSEEGGGKRMKKREKKKVPTPSSSSFTSMAKSQSGRSLTQGSSSASLASSSVSYASVAASAAASSSGQQQQQQQKFIDPYEHQESLQGLHENSLLDPENRDIVYTQTVEIVSDTEGEEEIVVVPPVPLNPSQPPQQPSVPGPGGPGPVRGGGFPSKGGQNSTVAATPQQPQQPEQQQPPEFDVLLSRLPLADVAATQAYLQQHLLLRRADIRRREALVRRMEAVLKRHGLPCQLYIFGSTKNGLGLRTSSDIDIFIQVKKKVVAAGGQRKENQKEEEEKEVAIDESHLTFGSVQRVLEATDRILSDDQSYLEEVAGEEGVKARITMSTICHRHMRVPLTRMKIYLQNRAPNSISSMLQCDLNANNALGIANTRLLRFLGRFEPRFHLLNVLLRYWAKTEALLNRPDALSSYALSNLLLFFFQARRPHPLLPPVDYFVRLNDALPGARRKIVNDWRCDFCRDPAQIAWRTENQESVGQLLVGFFRFYAAFDFGSVKISTRNGRLWRLRAGNRGQQENEQEFGGGGRGGRGRGRRGRGRGGGDRNSRHLPYVHIMDPFELNHNLTARMRPQMYEKMMKEFGRAGERYARYLDT